MSTLTHEIFLSRDFLGSCFHQGVSCCAIWECCAIQVKVPANNFPSSSAVDDVFFGTVICLRSSSSPSRALKQRHDILNALAVLLCVHTLTNHLLLMALFEPSRVESLSCFAYIRRHTNRKKHKNHRLQKPTIFSRRFCVIKVSPSPVKDTNKRTWFGWMFSTHVDDKKTPKETKKLNVFILLSKDGKGWKFSA